MKSSRIFPRSRKCSRRRRQSNTAKWSRDISFDLDRLPFWWTWSCRPWSLSTSSASPRARRFRLRCTGPPRLRIACEKSYETRCQLFLRDSPTDIIRENFVGFVPPSLASWIKNRGKDGARSSVFGRKDEEWRVCLQCKFNATLITDMKYKIVKRNLTKRRISSFV